MACNLFLDVAVELLIGRLGFAAQGALERREQAHLPEGEPPGEAASKSRLTWSEAASHCLTHQTSLDGSGVVTNTLIWRAAGQG